VDRSYGRGGFAFLKSDGGLWGVLSVEWGFGVRKRRF